METELTKSDSLQLLPNPVYSKTCTWGQLNAGNCVMQAGSTLVIYSDGHAVFQATVWTNQTHSGDTWRHTLYFNNSASLVIFQITLTGPDHMNDDGTHYAFYSAFNFPAGIYDAIATVSAQGNC